VDIIDKAELALYSQTGQVKSILAASIKAAARSFVTKKTKEEIENI